MAFHWPFPHVYVVKGTKRTCSKCGKVQKLEDGKWVNA